MEKALSVVERLNIPLYYKRVLKEFLTQLQPLANRIDCIALVGSIARREDFIEGWSDIDVLVVTKDRETVDMVKKVAEQLNKKYPRTRKNASILSLWIDDRNNVLKWLGLGCEYYNLMKNFVLLYGRDIRGELREPSEEELKRTLGYVAREADKYLSKFKIKEVLDNIDTLTLASYLYPLMRFYLCAKGSPTASRKEIIDLLKSRRINTSLTDTEINALVRVLEDLLETRQRVDPKLNRTVISAVRKIISEISEYSRQKQ